MATSGPQILNGTTSNDNLIGGSGNDTLNGGAGSDTVNGDSGNDTLVYDVPQGSTQSKDLYTGGSGIDTLVLRFTLQQWLSPTNQAQVASYLAHQNLVTNRHTLEISNSSNSDFVFTFGTSTLTVQMTELLRVFVDGVELNPNDELVTAVNDAATVGEEGPSATVNVLANDLVPDLVKSIAVVTAPGHGTATLVQPDALVPSGWYFSYQPSASYYQYLSSGQTATDTFAYIVTDADGDTSTATVTMTITGANDGVAITSSTQAGAVMEDTTGSTSGTITFDDIDLADSHTASVSASNSTALGTFSVGAVSEAAGASNGSVGWSYALNHGAAQHLGSGESVIEVFTVNVSDGNGSTTSQNVRITIAGTNDVVAVTSYDYEGTVVEDGVPASVNGSIAFSDADLTDTHAASFAASNPTSLGTFALGSVSESPTTAEGSVGWSYALDHAAAQYLAVGENVTEVFTVTLDDENGSVVTEEVEITITGTNDAVLVTSGVQEGDVTEDTAPGSTSGTIQFTDADLIDEHEVSVSSSNESVLGAFVLGTVSEAADTTGGSVGWTYTMDNAAAQYLGVGESETEVFTVEVDDGNGSTATQQVTVTINGTNDDVVVTSGVQAGAVTEDTAPGTTNGTIQFTDADLTDEHEVSVTSSNDTTLGAFVLGTVNESADTTGGSVGWTYTLDNADAQYLGVGETETEVFTVEVDDGNGSTATQQVTVTINGTNDDVVVTSGVQQGAVTEDTTPGTATGTIQFTDADLTDEHEVSVASSNDTALGAFVLGTASEAADTTAGSVGWTYTLDNVAAQYLGVGETETEVFTVEVDDGNGSTATQQVTLTINGTNDDVVVTSGVQAGAVTEDAAPGTASGTIQFTDADLTDEHEVSVTSSNDTTLGAFVLGTVSEDADTTGGSVGWTYTLDHADAQYLGVGETETEVFTVEVEDGNGSTATQQVTVTINGTNDDVVVTSGVQQGALTEDTAPGTATGTIQFTDADLTDEHEVSVTSSNDTALGAFVLGTVSEAADTTGGSVGWTYTLDNAAAQALGVGETETEVFTVEVDDGNGSTATQQVTVTINGTNDDVVITSGVQAGAVTEDTAPGTTNGTIQFTDADLTDEHEVSVSASNATALGSFVLGTVSEDADTTGGSVGWTYTLDHADAQYLGVGETETEVFTVEVDDGNGSTATQQVTVTINGTNDDVVVTSGVKAGAVTEDTAPGTATGTIQFTDADLTDEHEVSVTSSNDTALGAFVLGTVSEAADTAAGSVGWTYTLDNGAAQYLGVGETETEVFTVEVDDGNGSTATQHVTVTINGTNDDVVVTSGAQQGAVTEDTAPGTASGTIQFTDADLTDEHEVSVTSSNATALGAFVLGTVSEAATTTVGSVGWTYTLDNAASQYLAAGETEEEVFTLELDDGNGSTATQEVTVTITGVNDVVAVTSGAQQGTVTEDAGPSATGTIQFTDADLTDTHTTSVSSSNATTLGVFALAPISESATTDTGALGWTYTLNNTAAQYLAAGQSVTETFNVAISDGKGSTTSQAVTVTINGSNDAVTMTSSAQTGSVTEDGATTATGTLAFTDPDLADVHTATVAAAASNTTTLGILTLGSVSEAANAAAGTVGWTYNLNNAAAQYLAAGQTINETYIVSTTDGKGSTVTQNIVISIAGTADVPALDLAIVVDNLSPPNNNLPTGTDALPLAHFVGSGGTGSGYSYSMTPVTGLTLQSDGDLIGTLAESTTYTLNVTLTNNANTYLETFHIITGNGTANSIDSGGNDDVIYALNSTGSGMDIILAGTGDDWIFGQNGSDVIQGDEGNDVLTGGGNRDYFVFDTVLNATTNVDRITDMDATSAGKDIIRLSSTIFAGLSAVSGPDSTTLLAASSFRLLQGGITEAQTVNEKILYETSTGRLYYDADGSGAGVKVLFATLVGTSGVATVGLDASDFEVTPGP